MYGLAVTVLMTWSVFQEGFHFSLCLSLPTCCKQERNSRRLGWVGSVLGNSQRQAQCLLTLLPAKTFI